MAREGRARILVVDDDPHLRRALVRLLRDAACEVIEAEDGVEALELLPSSNCDLVLTDLHMPRADGMAVIRGARSRTPAVPVVVLTAQGSIDSCVAALRAGAFDFLAKPCHPTELLRVLNHALTPSDERLQRDPPLAVVGASPPMRSTLEKLAREASGDHAVLLRAEPGSGAEVLARLLHSASSRTGRAFVVVRSGPDDEQELSSGLADAAFGTLFIDDVALLSTKTQELLRDTLSAANQKTRLVAATRDPLSRRVAFGAFDAELAVVLERCVIEVPALRDRYDDIPLLAQHFLEDANMRRRRRASLHPEVLTAMRAYPWPGNVSELRSMIERIVDESSDEPDGMTHECHATVFLEDGSEIDVDLEGTGISAVLALGVHWVRGRRNGRPIALASEKITCMCTTARAPHEGGAFRLRARLRGAKVIMGWVPTGTFDQLLSEQRDVLVLHDGSLELHIVRAHVASFEPID